MAFETTIMQAIQSMSSPFFDVIFKFFTFLGSETFMIVLLAVFYWCVNKQSGERVAFSVLCSFTVNGTLKDIFRFTRPIGAEGINTSPSEAESLMVQNSPTGYQYSYSFPSGHSQNSASMFSGIALWLKKRWATICAVVISVLIGVSRMYLGVHWPKDVLVGLLLGALVTYGIFKLTEKVKNRIIAYGAIAVVLFVFGMLFAGTDDTIKALGSIFGFVFAVMFEKRFVDFSVDGPAWKRLVRAAVGLGLILGVKSGLKLLFPSLLVFDFIRYALVMFTGIGLYPWLFKKLKF